MKKFQTNKFPAEAFPKFTAFNKISETSLEFLEAEERLGNSRRGL